MWRSSGNRKPAPRASMDSIYDYQTKSTLELVSLYFKRVIDKMTAGSERIQHRLAYALIHLDSIPPEDMPLTLQTEYQDIRQQMSRIPDPNRGSFFATAEQLSDEEAQEIVGRLIKMRFAIEALATQEAKTHNTNVNSTS